MGRVLLIVITVTVLWFYNHLRDVRFEQAKGSMETLICKTRLMGIFDKIPHAVETMRRASKNGISESAISRMPASEQAVVMQIGLMSTLIQDKSETDMALSTAVRSVIGERPERRQQFVEEAAAYLVQRCPKTVINRKRAADAIEVIFTVYRNLSL